MNAVSSPIKPRPERPVVGPQARYAITGTNIGLSRDAFATFEDECHGYQAKLEWVLYNLEKFDEPSRHMILSSTAVHFGMPFDVVMGGML